MKKIILIFVMFFVVLGNSYAHKEPTHQYIVSEAYKLLKTQLGFDIPVMSSHIGNVDEGTYHCYWCDELSGLFGGCGSEFWAPPFRYGSVTAGAYAEDWQDFIYNKHNCLTVSVSHFWQSDGGRTAITSLKADGVVVMEKIDNAYQKVIRYLNGDWVAWDGPDENSGTYFTYNGLIDLYKTGRIKLVSRFQVILGVRLITAKYNYQEVTLPTSDKNRIVFNILGRIAHLLGDMSSVPHTHNSEHGWNKNKFEDAMNIFNDGHKDKNETTNPDFPEGVNNQRAFVGSLFDNTGILKNLKTGGGVIDPYKHFKCNPFCSGMETNEDRIEYLMKTTAQISEHFADHYSDGNDNLFSRVRCPTTGTPVEYSDLGELATKIKLSELGGPTTRAAYENSGTWAELAVVRDAVMPYVIRSTAGLLYWFAVEAGLLDNACISAYHTSQSLSAANGFLQHVHLRGNYYEFQAKDSVIAGKPNFGSSAHLLTIDSNADVTMHAGNKIHLNNGFASKLGSNTHIYVESCDYGCKSGNSTNKENGSGSLNKVLSEPEVPTNPTLRLSLNEKLKVPNGVRYVGKATEAEFSIRAVPNPLSSSTKIEYTVPNKCVAKLEITNSLGEVISNLVPESEHSRGVYQVEWKDISVPSGLYYCRLSTCGRQYVKSLVVNK